MDAYGAPSFYGHIINGLLIFIATIVVYFNWKSIRKMDSYKITLLILVFSIAIGVHGLSHLGLESRYSFNPLTGILAVITEFLVLV